MCVHMCHQDNVSAIRVCIRMCRQANVSDIFAHSNTMLCLCTVMHVGVWVCMYVYMPERSVCELQQYLIVLGCNRV